MREIKFRAWEVYADGGGYMRQVLAIDWEKRDVRCDHMDEDDWDDLESYILMQYTGLKDRNQRAIYEADIVQWGKCREPIEWDGDGWFCGGMPLGVVVEEFVPQVIGNIYENPELLT